MDYEYLNRKIAELQQSAQAAENGDCSWREVWDLIKSIGRSFKETRYPTRNDKDAAWNQFQEIIDAIKETQSRQREESVRQTEEIFERLDKLESDIENAKDGQLSWQEVWGSIKELGILFKETRFTSKVDRETAQKNFNNLVNAVKELQEQVKQEKEERARVSAERKDEILECAESGKPPFMSNDEVLSILTLGISEMISNFVQAGEELDEKKEQLQYWSEKVREAWELFKDHKEELLGRDKQEIFNKLREMQEELDQAWEEWKSSKQQYHDAKREAWEERVRENIEKLETRLEKLNEVLAHKEEHLTELEQKRDDAWNDDFRERVEGWIEEEERAIEEIKEKIDQIERWLEEERDKLS